MAAIERKVSTNLQKARDWTGEPKEERARRALRAINERDHETLLSLVVAYVTLHSGSIAENTVASYGNALRALLDTGYTLARLEPEEAALLLRGLEERYRPNTVGSYKSRLKVFYDALLWAGAYRGGANPFQNLKHRPERSAPEEQFDLYDDVELARLLSVAGPEERALLLGAHAGLRASEMCGLRWQDVALERGSLRVVSGKGGKARTVPLTASARAALGVLQPQATTSCVSGTASSCPTRFSA